MTITEREYQSIKEAIEHNHKAVMDMLELRKDYFDRQFSELCRSIKEMKEHCTHTQDQCAIVFRDMDSRIDKNTNDIVRIKTIGSVLAVVWGAVVTIASQFIRRLG